jgi:Mg2+/Co2+ transporter CorB
MYLKNNWRKNVMKRWNNLDKAIIGTTLTHQNGERIPVFVYSGDQIISILMERDGMEWDEAMDFIDYNIEGAYIGNDTPLLVWPVIDEEYEL